MKNIGDISEPIKVEHGWAVFRLTDHRATESLAYDKLKDDIDSSVKGVKFGQQTQDFIARLRTRVTISVHEDKLRE